MDPRNRRGASTRCRTKTSSIARHASERQVPDPQDWTFEVSSSIISLAKNQGEILEMRSPLKRDGHATEILGLAERSAYRHVPRHSAGAGRHRREALVSAFLRPSTAPIRPLPTDVTLCSCLKDNRVKTFDIKVHRLNDRYADSPPSPMFAFFLATRVCCQSAVQHDMEAGFCLVSVS